MRDVIKDLFRERDCATIVRPVVDEADLRNIQKLPYESLRPEFREQVEAFVKKVYMFLKPKKIDGQLVNGAMLVELAGEYCKAINSGVVPTIQSAWTSVVQHQLRLSLRDAVQTYRSRMNETAMQNLPLSEEKLRELHKEAKAEGLKLLLNARLDADPRFRESRAQFSSRVRQLFGHVTAENQSASQRQCDRLAHELYKPVEQKVLASGTYTSFHELAADWDRLRQAYLQKALGPAKAEVLLGRLGSQLLQSAQKVWEDFHTAGEERSQALKKQLADAEARFLGLKGSAEERSSHGIGVEVARRMELERLLEDARRSLTEATQKFAREKGESSFSLNKGDEYKFCWCLLTGRELQRAAAGMLLEGSADGRPEFHSEELPILFPMSSPEIDPTEASNLGDGYTFTGHLDLRAVAGF